MHERMILTKHALLLARINENRDFFCLVRFSLRRRQYCNLGSPGQTALVWNVLNSQQAYSSKTPRNDAHDEFFFTCCALLRFPSKKRCPKRYKTQTILRENSAQILLDTLQKLLNSSLKMQLFYFPTSVTHFPTHCLCLISQIESSLSEYQPRDYRWSYCKTVCIS